MAGAYPLAKSGRQAEKYTWDREIWWIKNDEGGIVVHIKRVFAISDWGERERERMKNRRIHIDE